MKFNWKVVVAAVLIVGAIYWAVSSSQSKSYSSTNLNFGVGGGVVTITNPSDAPIPVQLVGSGARSFTFASSTEGLTRGTSTRTGAGTSAVQTYAFDLPVGVTEFTVDRGTNVQFVAATPVRLEATAMPMSADMTRTNMIIAVVVIAGALYYMSSATGHAWLSQLRGRPAPVPVVVSADGGQGRATRAYGDNRTEQ